MTGRIYCVLVADAVGMPEGMAATQRLRNLAKGLSRDLMKVEILLVRPTEPISNPKNVSVDGYIDNIRYSYVCGTPFYAKTMVGRRLQEIAGIIRCFDKILKIRKLKDEVLIITYSRHLSTILPLRIVSRLFKIPLIAELCEWPLAVSARDKLTHIRKSLYCKCVPHLIDGAIPISRYIVDKLRIEKPLLPILKVPILINPEEISIIGKIPYKGYRYTVFSGSIAYTKTLSLILESFKIVSETHNDLRLVITGIEKQAIPKWLTDQADELSIDEKIIYSGFLPREELFEVYKNASALLIPLHNDEQSRSRFPTKIGEYLLSGSPVVTTDIGEVEAYLEDGVTAFIARSDSVNDFTFALQQALDESSLSRKVGIMGKKVGLGNFDYRIHGEKLYSWLLETYPQLLVR